MILEVIFGFLIIYGVMMIIPWTVVFVETLCRKRSRKRIYTMEDLFEEMKLVNKRYFDGLMSIPIIGLVCSIIYIVIVLVVLPFYLLYKIPLIKRFCNYIGNEAIKLYNWFMNIKFRDYE